MTIESVILNWCKETENIFFRFSSSNNMFSCLKYGQSSVANC